MDSPPEFDVRLPSNRVSLVRVMNGIKRLADPLHGAGGCSAFQISVELTRCLVAAFTLTLRDSSPTISQATAFAIRCHALALEYESDDGLSEEQTASPPEKDEWASFFCLVNNQLSSHPNTAVACEHSTLMVANIVYFASYMAPVDGRSPDWNRLCHLFADSQLEALARRAHREPKLLRLSIVDSLRSVIFKPSGDSNNCVFHVAKFLAQAMGGHGVQICSANISRALGKVLASCALWQGFDVDSRFVSNFLQQYLLKSPLGDHRRNMRAPDFDTSTAFLRLVQYCAVIWQPLDDPAYSDATELRERGEVLAVERVLDAVLRNGDPFDRASQETLEAVVVREPSNQFLTTGERLRVLYRRENVQNSVLQAGNSIRNVIGLAGAPPYHFVPPECRLTPVEIICYFPNVLCIPEIWNWVTGHGWSPADMSDLLNRARGLEGIWKSSFTNFYTWQRVANVAVRTSGAPTPPPPSPKLDISPYVCSYCDAPVRGRRRPLVDMTMSRLVYPVMLHPKGDDAGYFTAMARYAATNGDLGGKIRVSHIRETDGSLSAEEEHIRPRLEHGSLARSVGSDGDGFAKP